MVVVVVLVVDGGGVHLSAIAASSDVASSLVDSSILLRHLRSVNKSQETEEGHAD